MDAWFAVAATASDDDVDVDPLDTVLDCSLSPIGTIDGGPPSTDIVVHEHVQQSSGFASWESVAASSVGELVPEVALPDPLVAAAPAPTQYDIEILDRPIVVRPPARRGRPTSISASHACSLPTPSSSTSQIIFFPFNSNRTSILPVVFL